MQPNKNGCANLKHQIALEFPDYDWRIFTFPNDTFRKLNLFWPDPDYITKTYTILVSAEYGSSSKDLLFNLKNTPPGTTNNLNFSKPNKFPYRGKLNNKTIFALNIREVSEYTDLEELSVLLSDNFNKNIKDEVWLSLHGLTNCDVSEIEKKFITLCDRKTLQVRYRIKNLANKNEPLSNYLAIGFKLGNKVVFADFYFPEDDYINNIEKYYQIINTIKQIPTNQEFLNLTELHCGEYELQLRFASTSNYEEAKKIKETLDNEYTYTNRANKRPYKLTIDPVCIQIEYLMPELKEAIQHLKIDQTSEIIKVQSTYYIVKRNR